MPEQKTEKIENSDCFILVDKTTRTPDGRSMAVRIGILETDPNIANHKLNLLVVKHAAVGYAGKMGVANPVLSDVPRTAAMNSDYEPLHALGPNDQKPTNSTVAGFLVEIPITTRPL